MDSSYKYGTALQDAGWAAGFVLTYSVFCLDASHVCPIQEGFVSSA